MLTTNKQRANQVYDCVKKFHIIEELPSNLPNPQHKYLLPSLRPYQIKAVNWMLYKEMHNTYYQSCHGKSSSSESAVQLPKGGILADEMGLGKTVEVLACILSNPRKERCDYDEKPVVEPTEQLFGKCVEEDFDNPRDKQSTSKQEPFDNDETPVVKPTECVKKYSDDTPEKQLTLEETNPTTSIPPLKGEQTFDNGICRQNISDTLSVVQLNNSDQPTEEGTVEILNDDLKPLQQRILESGFAIDCDIKTLKYESEFTEKKNSRKNKRKNADVNVNGNKNKRRKKDNISILLCNEDSTSVENQSGSKAQTQELKSKEKGANYTLLKAWYEDCLSQTTVSVQKRKRERRQERFQCCCIGDVSSDSVIECPDCNTWQHVECVGYDETTADYQYYCFRCWQSQPLVKSAGTVIVSPEAISQQWVTEIEKHVKKNLLKVLVYEGVRVNGYIQPHDLASYDIVITTYQVLSKELNYTHAKERNLRHTKRFHIPTPPLLYIEWWRLCLDEAQMVEGSTSRAAEMAKKFTAVNKWAVTGTPIQKAVNDLTGLMEFLAGKEFLEFNALANRDWHSLLMLVPRILWRTQMKDVLEEAGVPPQTVDVHMLDFTKIEKYFYQCTHNECSQQFLDRITKCIDLNATLKSLDRKFMSRLLNPLLRLRQACLHPQAVRGKFVSIKKTMTMGDLVTQMVTNAKLDAEQALRQLVASLNGAGALHIIRKEWGEAAAAYRAVLHLEQEHKGRLKIDSLQKIHSMHNLAEVLDGGYVGIPPTLRDGTLRQDIQALELPYLGSREAPMKATKERIKQHSQAIQSILETAPGATLGYSEWFLRVLEWSSDREELLDRLKAAIQHTDAQQKNQYNNLANKLKSLYVVRMEVATWLADLDHTRQEAHDWLELLYTSDKDEIASDAQLCHLPQSLNIKKRIRCKLCKAETTLKKYEALLFEEKSKEKRKPKKRNLPGSSDWKDDKDLDNYEIAQLADVNVNTFKSSKKGGFKASPIEKILKALATYGRHKQAPNIWTKEANSHMKLLNLVKKEFLDINLMWRQIFDLVDAKDELNMCKTRLRLPYYEEEEEIQNKKKKIGENHHIISPYRVEPELMKMQSEREQYEVLVKKKVGTMCYLQTLQKEGAPPTICPICRNDLSDKWAVLACGHCTCLECLSLLSQRSMQSVACPQCRQSCSMTAVSYVESEPSHSQTKGVKGSYSTKVGAIVSQTLKLTHLQPDVKILIFSVWEKVLDLLTEAFEENSITFRRLKAGKMKQRQALRDFKTGDVSVLLLPLRSGAKGLNLVEATHVFLVEPILNPAEELQAVGRVHRIGQTRPTVVHRFIVRETIEERILTAVAESGADQWSDDCVTLQQLYDLFTSNSDSSLIQSLVTPGPTNDNSSSSSSSVSSDSEGEDTYETAIEYIDSQ